MLIVYVPLGVLYIIPCVYLHRYANQIRQLEMSGQIEALERAMEAQKSFWKFVGMFMAVVVSIYVAILCFGLVALLVGAASS